MATTKKTTSKATNVSVALQNGTDRTVYAKWSWSKSNTANYKVRWYYATGNGIWFKADETEVSTKQSVYTAPGNAERVRFAVKPISKKKKVNKKEVSYWTADWSTYKYYEFSSNPPATPSAPTVEIDKYKLTATLQNAPDGADQIEFEVVRDNTSKVNKSLDTSSKEYKVLNNTFLGNIAMEVYKKATVSIKDVTKDTAIYSCTISSGHEYKVRCRAIRKTKKSEWSEYSSPVQAMPTKVGVINELVATTATSVRLSWDAARSATSYDIEHTTDKSYFDSSNSTTVINSITTTSYTVTGLTSGQTYYFRVRAVNSQGPSAWTTIKSIVVGKKPSPPTTWSSSTTAKIGENITLNWTHNSEDNSKQRSAQIQFDIGGNINVITLQTATSDEDVVNKIYSHIYSTSGLYDGAVIKWKVRTKGILADYSEWSVERVINVYAPPTLAISVTNNNGVSINRITELPMFILANQGPASQHPIGFQVTIKSNEAYETVDYVGNFKMVNEDEEVFSEYYDTDENLILRVTASSIDLENNVSYTINAVVTTDAGLTAEANFVFTVAWNDEDIYTPNAEIAYDEENLSMNIRPYCAEYTEIVNYYRVIFDNATQLYKRSTIINTQTPIEGTSTIFITTNNDLVYRGLVNGIETLYCEVETEETELVDGVTLSVYRIDYDGRFVEIGREIPNNNSTFVVDPHPPLNHARYRIVATDINTGAMGFYDIPGYPTGEQSIVIQWDEQWHSYEIDDNPDDLEAPSWAGSMLKLPYNIDVTDDASPDVDLVEYIGRRHPVSYYGTQVGSTATWNVQIDKKDINTLYALRRLMVWLGDIYVREPSGSGYWANVTVNFKQTHNEVTIPVSLKLTRVEGGV